MRKILHTPVAIFKPDKVIDRYNHWMKFLPYIKPYYAVKSLCDESIISTLAKTDIIGFDVASINEIKQVIPYSKDIILSHPIKQVEDITFAKDNNIRYIVADSITEVKKIKSVYPEAEIIWRIKSYEKHSDIKFNAKFGATIEQTKNAIEKYNLKNISYHVGSKCNNMESHLKTIQTILSLNSDIKMIDIGGGFTSKNDIVKLSELLSPLQHNHLSNIKIVAEPGRYFSQSSLDIINKVIGVKRSSHHMDIFVNDSIYYSFSGKPFDHQEFLPKPLYKSNKALKCTIWGNTCDGEDKIMENISLPIPKINDLIKWENMGAYSLANAVDGFNGFPKTSVIWR